jgi:four helix bundle protein
MAGVRTFEDLKAWQQARNLVAKVRAATCSTQLRRDRSFSDQILRAARSVMSNIAEGFESNSRAEFNRYLGIARGSCAEVRSQLYEAQDAELLDAGSQERLMELAKSTANLVSSLKISVERKLSPKSRKAPVNTS